jgi:hypothetical protein
VNQIVDRTLALPHKKNGPSVETERPLTIACHMKILEVAFVLTITA